MVHLGRQPPGALAVEVGAQTCDELVGVGEAERGELVSAGAGRAEAGDEVAPDRVGGGVVGAGDEQPPSAAAVGRGVDEERSGLGVDPVGAGDDECAVVAEPPVESCGERRPGTFAAGVGVAGCAHGGGDGVAELGVGRHERSVGGFAHRPARGGDHPPAPCDEAPRELAAQTGVPDAEWADDDVDRCRRGGGEQFVEEGAAADPLVPRVVEDDRCGGCRFRFRGGGVDPGEGLAVDRSTVEQRQLELAERVGGVEADVGEGPHAVGDDVERPASVAVACQAACREGDELLVVGSVGGVADDRRAEGLVDPVRAFDGEAGEHADLQVGHVVVDAVGEGVGRVVAVRLPAGQVDGRPVEGEEVEQAGRGDAVEVSSHREPSEVPEVDVVGGEHEPVPAADRRGQCAVGQERAQAGDRHAQCARLERAGVVQGWHVGGGEPALTGEHEAGQEIAPRVGERHDRPARARAPASALHRGVAENGDDVGVGGVIGRWGHR